MEAIFAIPANLWLAIPDWLRPVVIFGIIFIVFNRPLQVYLPKLISLLMYCIQKCLEFIYFILLVIFGYIVEKKRKKGETRFPIIDVIEDKMVTGIHVLVKVRTVHMNTNSRRKKKWIYRTTIIVIFLVLMFSVKTAWPKIIANPWYTFDNWLTYDVFHAETLTHERAVRNVKGWVGIKEKPKPEETIAVRYKLSTSQDSGNIRENPVANLDEDNIILEIDHNTVLLYFGESKNVGGIEWYKVETINRTTGWISSRIIEKMN